MWEISRKLTSGPERMPWRIGTRVVLWTWYDTICPCKVFWAAQKRRDRQTKVQGGMCAACGDQPAFSGVEAREPEGWDAGCAGHTAHCASAAHEPHDSGLDGSTLYSHLDSLFFNRIKNKSPPLQGTLRKCLPPFLVELKLGISSYSPVSPRNTTGGQWLSIGSAGGLDCGQQNKGTSLLCVTVIFCRSGEAGFLKAGHWLFIVGAIHPS